MTIFQFSIFILLFVVLPFAYFFYVLIATSKKWPVIWTAIYPFFIGLLLSLIFDRFAGTSGPAAAIGMALVFLLLYAGGITILTSAVAAYVQRALKFFAISFLTLLLGFAIGVAWDVTFIEDHEVGEKGNAWIYSKYPEWRIRL